MRKTKIHQITLKSSNNPKLSKNIPKGVCLKPTIVLAVFILLRKFRILSEAWIRLKVIGKRMPKKNMAMALRNCLEREGIWGLKNSFGFFIKIFLQHNPPKNKTIPDNNSSKKQNPLPILPQIFKLVPILNHPIPAQ